MELNDSLKYKSKYIIYSIKKFDEEYKQLCEEKKLFYSPDLLWTILSTTSTFIDCVSKNIFLKDLQSILIKIGMYSCKLQSSIRRCINRWRKKRILSCNSKDLSFSSFSDDRIEILIDSRKYTFHPYEISQLIFSSLLNVEIFMIVNPLPIKNPYTGIPFSKHMLYYFYIHLKKIHPLFYYYAKVNFDLKQFLLQYEGILRTHLIEKTVLEYNDNKLAIVCSKMLEDLILFNFITCKYEPIVTIDKIKPHLLKPLLLQYYHSLFSLNPYQREIEYKSLIHKLVSLRDQPNGFMNTIS